MRINYEQIYKDYKAAWQEYTITQAALGLTGAIHALIEEDKYSDNQKLKIIDAIENTFYDTYMNK